MRNCNNFLLCFLSVTAVYQAISTSSASRLSNRTPRWRDLGGDYNYYIEKHETLTWIDAVYYCFAEGGSLASFHTTEEMERVVYAANTSRTGLRLHIGLRKNNDGSFQWVDKRPVEFTLWYPGEPNLRDEKCTELYVDFGLWNDEDCYRESEFVCSQPKSSPIRERKSCPHSSPDWNDFGGDACYIIEEDDKTTWPNALSRCSAKGGSLASFHSIEEISAVVQRTKSSREDFHIGLQKNNDGSFSWTDQSPMDLDYWGTSLHVYSSEYTDSFNYKQCGEMQSGNGEWSDVSCGKPSGYICSIPKVGQCGGLIIGNKGDLKSPNYPGKYGRNEDCRWTIRVEKNHRIFLKFLTFDVHYSIDCEEDFVEVRDGNEATSGVLGKFCGQSVPDTIVSTGNEMTVLFSSNHRRQDLGFLAEFEEDICGGDMNSDSGIFSTPNFPERYRKNENCVWQITVPEDHQVILLFLFFEIEDSGDDCNFDYVEIRDGHDSNSTPLGVFCGSNQPAQIRSSTNKLTVRFVTDDFSERSGFQATFRKIGSNQELGNSSLRVLSNAVVLEKLLNAKERISNQ